MKPPILELVKALEWYEERLNKLIDKTRSVTYLEAVITELCLDNGKRARDAIKNVEPLQ